MVFYYKNTNIHTVYSMDMNTKNIIKEYQELYDTMTIKICLSHLAEFNAVTRANIIELLLKTDITYGDYQKGKDKAIMISLIQIREIIQRRAREKEGSIKQNLLDNAERERRIEKYLPLKKVLCNRCSADTVTEESFVNQENSQILTFYKCIEGCLPMQLLYPNGEIYKISRSICELCYHDMKAKKILQDAQIRYQHICEYCGYTKLINTKIIRKTKEQLEWLNKIKKAFCK